MASWVNSNGFDGRCKIICGNALEQSYEDATCFFLYLVPRGLKIVFKEVIEKLLLSGKSLRIVTYMSALAESIPPTHVFKVATKIHPEAQWPLFYYNIDAIRIPETIFTPSRSNAFKSMETELVDSVGECACAAEI